MLTRLVKMTFRNDKVKDFLHIFHSEKEKIKSFEGCHHVELLNDIRFPNIFFTRSIWESEIHLEKYRNSDFFKGTWEKTKKLFAERPEAWTTELIEKKGSFN